MLKRGRKLLIGRKSRLSAKYLPPLPSIKQIIIDYIDRASTYTRVPVKFIEGLKECSHTIELSIPLKRDDGSKDMFKAWRSHHSTHALPLKGGVRYSPYTNKEEIEAVAILMTMKSAVA